MLDPTIHLGDVAVAAGFLIGGWRFAATVRDTLRDLQATVYGSEKPPVKGLVARVRELEEARVRP